MTSDTESKSENETNAATRKNQPRKIGLIAGWGRYPVVIATALRERGYQVFCVGIRDHADPALRQITHDYCEMGLAKLGSHLRYFLRNDVNQITMAGKIYKVRVIGRFAWIKHFPDLTTVRTFYQHFFTAKKDRRDDTLLSAVVERAARSGFTTVPATEFAPELLVDPGHLAGPRLSFTQNKDVRFAWETAKGLARLDIGQTVVVNGQAVLAVEAIEGTDECVRRAGRLCRSGGFTVVKVAKPQQDMRFDVPTIGMGTLQTISQAGGRVLAVEAEKTILIDQQEVFEFAKRHHIGIVAMQNRAMQREAA